MRNTILFSMVVAILGLQALEGEARTISRQTNKLIMIDQTTGGDGIESFTANIGVAGANNDGAITTKLGLKTLSAPEITEGITVSVPVASERALQTFFNDYVAAQTPRLINDLTAAMRAHDAGRAVYTFTKRIEVRPAPGVTVPKDVKWILAVEAGGKPVFGRPRIINPEPIYVLALYIPKTVSDALDPGWQYVDAGKLRYVLVNKKMQPQSIPFEIDMEGAYDELQPVSDTDAVDSDWGLRCLITGRSEDSTMPCPAKKTIHDLIDELGADGAMVDYGRNLAPIYDEYPKDDGTVEYRARYALDVRYRSIDYLGCESNSVNFRNISDYGYLLASQIDQYLVDKEANYVQYNAIIQAIVSPLKEIDKTLNLPKADMASFGDKLISPYIELGQLVAAADVPELIGLAGLTKINNSLQNIATHFSTPTKTRYPFSTFVTHLSCNPETNNLELRLWDQILFTDIADCSIYSGGLLQECNLINQAIINSGYLALMQAGMQDYTDVDLFALNKEPFVLTESFGDVNSRWDYGSIPGGVVSPAHALAALEWGLIDGYFYSLAPLGWQMDLNNPNTFSWIAYDRTFATGPYRPGLLTNATSIPYAGWNDAFRIAYSKEQGVLAISPGNITTPFYANTALKTVVGRAFVSFNGSIGTHDPYISPACNLGEEGYGCVCPWGWSWNSAEHGCYFGSPNVSHLYAIDIKNRIPLTLNPDPRYYNPSKIGKVSTVSAYFECTIVAQNCPPPPETGN